MPLSESSHPSSTAEPLASELDAALQATAPDPMMPVVVSRVTTRDIAPLVSPRPMVERPVVRGRTMWSGSPRGCGVVEHPNALGLLERDILSGSIVITTIAGAPLPEERECTVIAHAGNGAGDDFDAHTGWARILRGAILQIRGVRAVVPEVESPRIAVLLPVDPVRVLELPAPHGVTATPIGSHLPEYAGGLRLDIGHGITRHGIAAYAAGLIEVITPVEGT